MNFDKEIKTFQRIPGIVKDIVSDKNYYDSIVIKIFFLPPG